MTRNYFVWLFHWSRREVCAERSEARTIPHRHDRYTRHEVTAPRAGGPSGRTTAVNTSIFGRQVYHSFYFSFGSLYRLRKTRPNTAFSISHDNCYIHIRKARAEQAVITVTGESLRCRPG